MIELREISRYYNKIVALKNINLKLSRGKIYGLLGPNGSGKSTLIKIILKIIEPSSGEIVFDDKSLTKNFFNSIGYLPEERGLYLNSSVVEVLSYFGKLKSLSGKELNSRIDFWLERLELKEAGKFQIGQLSKGNQQKVQLIVALLHEPELLILDEPYSGFDPLNQQLLNEIIKEYSDTERTIILSTHLMNFVEDVCSDVIFLNKGDLIYTGSLKSLFGNYSEDTLLVEFDKNKETEELLKDANFKNLKVKHPPLNKIFLEELKRHKPDNE